MNDQFRSKAPKEKTNRTSKTIKDREESGEESVRESLDELLVVKKANILRKSKSDACSSSHRLSRQRAARSVDNIPAVTSSSESSFGSALSENPSRNKIDEFEADIVETEAAKDSAGADTDDLSNTGIAASTNTMVVEISSQSFHPTSCDDVPLHTLEQSASALPSIPETPSNVEENGTMLVPEKPTAIEGTENYTEDDFKNVASGILLEAIAETNEIENSRTDDIDSQDLAEMLTSVAVSQACLETLEENRAKKIEELEKQREEEAATNKELLVRLSELQDFKDRLSGLVTSIESSYSDAYSTLAETHTYQMEAYRLEAEKCRKELVCEINDLSARLLVSEARLAGKEEIETALQERLADLQRKLDDKEKHCKEELECLVSKNLKNEALMEAKGEVVMEDLLDTSMDQFGDIDRAWLVADLRRAESELSLNGDKEEEKSWMKSNLHCNFMTVHNPQLQDFEHELGKKFSSPRSKKKSKIPERVKAMHNADLEALKKKTIELEGTNSEFVLLLEQYKQQVESHEKEKLTLLMKNSSLQEELENINSRIKDVIDENESLLMKVGRQEEELVFAEKKMSSLLSEKNALIGVENKNRELSEKLTNLQNECDDMQKKSAAYENEVLEMRNVSETKNLRLLEELEKRESAEMRIKALEAELVMIQSVAHSAVISENVKPIAKAEISVLENSRDSLESQLIATKLQCTRLQQEFNQSRLSLDSSRRGDSTIYMEYFPSSLMDVSCQVEEVPIKERVITNSASCQTEKETVDARCAHLESELAKFKVIVDKLVAEKQARRRPSLEEELETSWTERCEVEEQLACALAEKTVLTRRIHQIEDAGRHLLALISSGVKSTSSWLGLYESIKDILDDLAVLSGSQEKGEQSEGRESSERSIQILADTLQNKSNNSPDSIYKVNAGERMEPEGGALPPDSETFLTIEPLATDELTQTEAALLDQSSNALIDVVQELLRYMGACEDDINESLGENQRSMNVSSLLETSGGPDLRGELKRCVFQLKEEVAHIFAISRRSEPGATAHLQEEIRSLEQQVASSDKQVKSMRAFVEEQAAERELERDEFSRRIEELNEVLRQKERQIVNFEQLKTDVEHLELQLLEANSALKKSEEDRSSVVMKLDDAMSKIWTMRDIISDLEKDIASRCEELEAVKTQNTRLHDQLVQLDKISLEMETANRDSHTDLLAYVAKLEEEVTALRHRVELSNPASLAAVRTSLRDLEFVVARSTKDLELVIVGANGLSSASEELSTRDHVDATRCQTPDEMRGDMPLGLEEDVDRLKERLMKHTRAEEVALKRLREMEHHSRKVEQLQVDLEVAQERLESYLSENATLKAKIEEQRPKAMQKQLLIDMEHRARQLEKDLEAAQDACRTKEQLLVESRMREERLVEAMAAQEAIFRSEYSEQNAVKNELLSERHRAEAATTRLQELSELPNVVNVLLAKKNEEIDILKQQVSTKEFTSSCTADSCLRTQSSTASGKRVKFSVPESFVESITPIPLEQGSVMRNAFESRDEWSFTEQCSRQCLPWKSISSIAALQLSPRGTSVEKSLPHFPVEPSSSLTVQAPLPENIPIETSLPAVTDEKAVISESIVELENIKRQLLDAQHEIGVLKGELQEKIESCDILEESLLRSKQDFSEKERNMTEMTQAFQENVAVLNHKNVEAETIKEQLDSARKDLEVVKYQYEDEIALIKNQLEQVHGELSKKISEIAYVRREAQDALNEACEKNLATNNILKQRQTEIENLNERIQTLLDELQTANSALEESKKEVEYLNKRTQSLCEQLKTEKESNEKKACDADANFQDVIQKLTKQQRETASLKESLQHAYEELEAVKSEKEGIIDAWQGKKDSVERLLKAKEIELDSLQHLLPVKENEVVSARKEVEEKQELIERLCKEKESLGLQLARKENELSSVQKLLAVKNDEIVSVRKDSEEKLSILKARLDKDKDVLDMEREKLNCVLLELEKFKETKPEVEERKTELGNEGHKFLGAGGDAGSLNFRENPLNVGGEMDAQSKQEVDELREQIKLLERLVESLESRLKNELGRYKQDATIMSHLSAALEQSVEKVTVLQGELMAARRRCDDLVQELTLSSQQLRIENDSARVVREASLRREEELMNQLTAAQGQNRRLTHLVESQAVQIHALSQLNSHDINASLIVNGGVPRMVRSAGDGAESLQEWRLRVTRLESHRKALVWQKRFLQGSGRQRSVPWASRRRITFRTAAILIIALFRMKFLVRRWRSRLPPLASSSSGKERRIGLTSPPTKDPGLRPRIAH